MIHFFRKLRQEFIEANSFKKYLVYAIGEILLVVFGILIALQINNWNQSKLENEKELGYLKNIQNDLYNQLESINTHSFWEQNYYKAANRILIDYFANSTLKIDSSFMADLSILTGRRTFVSIDLTYTDLVSSGNIGLISDEQIRLAIIEYYQSIERIEKIIQNNNTLIVDNKYAPVALKLGTLSDEYLLQGERDYFDSFGAKYFSSGQNKQLTKISKELFNIGENELLFINLLNLRNNTALVQYSWMMAQKDKTLELIEKIEKNLSGREK